MSTAILDAFVTLLTENPEIIPDRDDLQLQLLPSHPRNRLLTITVTH